MLDNETKRRVDTARDILVGKVPDPKSQVEQITIALIFKFMDDMDRDSIEMGGKASFFTGEYERYAWSKIFDPRIGGFEMLNLYAEAIVKLNQNPGIPQLFRDIFKNAYLPYRDPETLKLFLKTINEFTYDHSEKLGDAFEYLLSVLGSQGDAGQFRTPRHIIDFMVQVIKPQKNEIILDPACGTAGFLISSYKCIIKENTKTRSGDQLQPEERTQLFTNFKGYDISPDMVRLSLVNMYLHGFVQPLIYEYDTLTSEDRWNDYADVILANPPFMSPKGGIKPHKRFSVQSNRSEVLFVDYIAEHLTPSGRAAVIVPEGIIFQSAGAYKQLRKLLVEKFLYAVVSLPAGVFNPYSGVKTSILLLDRQIARKTDSILFVKVENDGFSLGAQRKEITGSNLPDAIRCIDKFVKTIRSEHPETFIPEDRFNGTLLVSKDKLAGNGEYNLTGDRYKTTDKKAHQVYRMEKLGDVCTLFGGGTPSKVNPEFWTNGSIKWISSKYINDYHEVTGYDLISKKALDQTSTRLVPVGSIIMITRVSVGKFAYADQEYAINQDLTAVVPSNQVHPKFLYQVSKKLSKTIERNSQGIGVRGVTRDFVAELEIPLPPLEVQQEIVEEIEGYQKIIDGARQVVENWKPKIEIDPEWPLVRLGDVCEITSSKRIFQEEYVLAGIPFYRTKEIVELSQGKGVSLELFISEERFKEIETKFGAPKKDDILLSAVGTIGISWIVSDDREFYFKDGNLLWLRNFLNSVDVRFIKTVLDVQIARNLHLLTNGAAYNALTIIKLKELTIPLPRPEIQKGIVAKIEHECKTIDACRELISVYEGKIKEVIDKVWGK